MRLSPNSIFMFRPQIIQGLSQGQCRLEHLALMSIRHQCFEACSNGSSQGFEPPTVTGLDRMRIFDVCQLRGGHWSDARSFTHQLEPHPTRECQDWEQLPGCPCAGRSQTSSHPNRILQCFLQSQQGPGYDGSSRSIQTRMRSGGTWWRSWRRCRIRPQPRDYAALTRDGEY